MKTFVEKAVRGVSDLAIIKTQARQLVKLGHTVSLPQYYELLEDAAMAYDLTHGRASSTQPRRSRRHVYEHAQLSKPYTVENHDVFHDYDDNNDPFDIDTPLYLVQAGMQRPTRPLLPCDTWFALKPHDQQTWDKITDEGKATIREDYLKFPGISLYILITIILFFYFQSITAKPERSVYFPVGSVIKI